MFTGEIVEKSTNGYFELSAYCGRSSPQGPLGVTWQRGLYCSENQSVSYLQERGCGEVDDLLGTLRRIIPSPDSQYFY